MGDSLNYHEKMVASNQDNIRPYIKLIDQLRQLGLEKDVPLPAIIVIGDQSSGKSSILEAISGIEFPRGQELTTRCPLTIQCQMKQEPWSAGLMYEGLDKKLSIQSPNDVSRAVIKAQDEITHGKSGLSETPITIEISGPQVNNLTLIDLPGIARCATSGQTEDIYKQTSDIIKSAIKSKNALILCVMDAHMDFARNEVISLAKQFDPDHDRTLGVLTKADLVVDFAARQRVCEILGNKVHCLKHGYRLVRCRTAEELREGISMEDVVHKENVLFMEEGYDQIDKKLVGVPNLSKYLTEKLVYLIKATLPSLRKEIRHLFAQHKKDLEALPDCPPTADHDKMSYFFKIRHAFLLDVQEKLTKGEWDQDIQATNSKSDPEVRQSLFSIWRESFEEFQSDIILLSDTRLKKGGLNPPKLKVKMVERRGRELSGFQNYALFESLIKEHLKLYVKPAEKCLDFISENLAKIIILSIDKYFSSMPGLVKIFRTESESCQKASKDDAWNYIEFIFKTEDLIFTQDEHFAEVKSKLAVNNGPDDDVKRMHELIKGYLQIVNRRLSDLIPNIIRTSLHFDFYNKLSDRVSKLGSCDVSDNTGQSQINDCIVEDEKTAQRRKQLTEKIKQFEQAMSKINETAIQ